jgi:hypothetical protein
VLAARENVDTNAATIDAVARTTTLARLAELVVPARFAAAAAVSFVGLEVDAADVVTEVGRVGCRARAFAFAAHQFERALVVAFSAVVQVRFEVDAPFSFAVGFAGWANALAVHAALLRGAGVSAFATIRGVDREIEATLIPAGARGFVGASALALDAALADVTDVTAKSAVIRVSARRHARPAVVRRVVGAHAALLGAALIGPAGVVASAAVCGVLVPNLHSVARSAVVGAAVAVVVDAVAATFDLVELAAGANVVVQRFRREAGPVVGGRATGVRSAGVGANPARGVDAHAEQARAIVALFAAFTEAGISAG